MKTFCPLSTKRTMAIYDAQWLAALFSSSFETRGIPDPASLSVLEQWEINIPLRYKSEPH
jgi:hypothetical protein